MTNKIRSFKHILVAHIKSYSKRFLALQKDANTYFEKKKAIKRSPMKVEVRITINGLEGASAGVKQPIRVDIRDLDYGMTMVSLLESLSHGQMAESKCQAGNFEDSLIYLLKAEHALGCATAYSQIGMIESKFAQGKASLSHVETNSMRAQVIKHWRERCSPKLSAQKAANELLGIFRWKNGTDVAHRTLASWIAKARKSG